MLLILDTRTAILGAKEGISQCISVIIPSLFPFFFVSGLFSQYVQQMNLSILSPLCKLCKMPKGSESLLIVGLLGGYPVGAREISVAYNSGALNKNDAERLLGFCNNAGPSFIFGIVAFFFANKKIGFWILIIQILSAILTAVILPGGSSEIMQPERSKKNLMSVFNGSIRSIVSVCSWIILFRIVLSFLERWFFWCLPDSISVILTALLELGNGCTRLGAIQNHGLRMIVSSAALSFGGFCVYLQTISVSENLGAQIYFPGKVIQCCLSILLSGIAQYFLFEKSNIVPLSYLWIPLLVIFLVSIVRFLPFFKKRVAFLHRLMYNQ